MVIFVSSSSHWEAPREQRTEGRYGRYQTAEGRGQREENIPSSTRSFPDYCCTHSLPPFTARRPCPSETSRRPPTQGAGPSARGPAPRQPAAAALCLVLISVKLSNFYRAHCRAHIELAPTQHTGQYNYKYDQSEKSLPYREEKGILETRRPRRPRFYL